MIRAFTLEWLKLKHYRVFWILFGLYLLAQLIITNGGTTENVIRASFQFKYNIAAIIANIIVIPQIKSTAHQASTSDSLPVSEVIRAIIHPTGVLS